MNKAFDKLPDLIQEELDASNALHPGFHSAHEGYAVLLEEVGEAAEELDVLKSGMENLWRNVKNDNSALIPRHAGVICFHAARMAAEAIQVAAMAQKILDSVKAGWSA